MKLFLAGASLCPAYGGPAHSVSRLASALTEGGVQVGLWAPDQSAATTPFLALESPVQRLTGSATEALERFGRPDVLHDNGIWLRHNHQLAQLAIDRGIPRIVSTRGMLQPWAINHKRLKKRLAWWSYQRRDLKQARYHHTTADEEGANLGRLGLGVPVCVIPNGVDVPPIDGNTRGAQTGKQKTALFLGRIYPVKGLPMLVEAWARAMPVVTDASTAAGLPGLEAGRNCLVVSSGEEWVGAALRLLDDRDSTRDGVNRLANELTAGVARLFRR